MRERLLVLALAAGALGLFYVLLFPKPRPASADLARPLSTESRPEGYLAVWRWLKQQQVPAASLRYRYDRLPALLPRATGNLLLISMPQLEPPRAAELQQLERWVEAGNTLLIMAAIDDTPLWAIGGDTLFQDKLEHLAGVRFKESVGVIPSVRRDLKAGTAARFVDLTALTRGDLDIQPRGQQPLVAGVRHIAAVSTLPVRSAQLQGLDDSLPLVLAARTDNSEAALWLVRRGAGQIILSGIASPFSNAAVALADNGRLLTNIIAWSRGAGGTVVFDDAHQGATAYYDGKAFFADSRLQHTLLWTVLLWLAYVLGALPLRAVQRSWQPLDEGAYVEASARYFAAVVPPGEAAQRLIERFLEGLQGPTGPGHDGSLWERFDTHSRISAAQRRTLHRVRRFPRSNA